VLKTVPTWPVRGHLPGREERRYTVPDSPTPCLLSQKSRSYTTTPPRVSAAPSPTATTPHSHHYHLCPAPTSLRPCTAGVRWALRNDLLALAPVRLPAANQGLRSQILQSSWALLTHCVIVMLVGVFHSSCNANFAVHRAKESQRCIIVKCSRFALSSAGERPVFPSFFAALISTMVATCDTEQERVKSFTQTKFRTIFRNVLIVHEWRF